VRNFEKGHRQKRLTVHLINLMNRTNVGMVESSGCSSLTEESLFRFLVAEQVRGQEFQRHLALEFGVLSLINDTHAALAELLDDLVMADCGADVQDAAIVPQDSRKGLQEHLRVTPVLEIRGTNAIRAPREGRNGLFLGVEAAIRTLLSKSSR